MEHEKAQEILSSYLDGEVAAPDRAGLESHLAACAECRDHLEELRKLSGLLRARGRSEAPIRLRAKVLAAAREAPASRPWLKPVLALSAAAAAVAVVLETGPDLVPFGTGRVQGMVSGAAGSLGETPLEGADEERTLPPNLAPSPPPPEPKVFAGKKASEYDRARRIEGAGAGGASAAPSDRAEPAAPFNAAAEREAQAPAAAADRDDKSLALAGAYMESAWSARKEERAGGADSAVPGIPSAELRGRRPAAGRKAPPASRAAGSAPPAPGSAAPAPQVPGPPGPAQVPRAMRAAEKSRPGSLIQAFDAEPDQAQEPSGAPASKTDWKGISGRDLGEDREVVVRDAGSWISLWALLSPEAVPLIDFGEEMVVGVVLASPDPGGKGGEGGNLLSVETSGQGMVVRYEGPRPGPHTLGGEGNRVFLYHLRAVPRTDRPVRFQRR